MGCTQTHHTPLTPHSATQKLNLEIFTAWYLKTSCQMEERLFVHPCHHVFSPPAHAGVAVAGLIGPISVFLSYLGQPTQQNGRVPWGYQLLLGDNASLGTFSLACHCSRVGCGQEGWDLADT